MHKEAHAVTGSALVAEALGFERPLDAAPPSFEQHVASLGLIDRDQIGPLVRTARRQRVSSLSLMLAEGMASQDELYGALAAFHDIPYLAHAYRDLKPVITPDQIEQCLRDNWIVLETHDGQNIIAAAPRTAEATTMRHVEGKHGLVDPIDAITTPAAIRAWIRVRYGDLLITNAADSVALRDASLSARRIPSRTQVAVMGAVVALLLAVALASPALGLGSVYLIAALAFMAVATLRLLFLLVELPGQAAAPPAAEPEDDAALPVYSILVPLRDEADRVPRLIEALWRLDYPRAKLDIKFVVERDDEATRKALDRFALPGCFETVVVPPASPRTKAKALNYALAGARGIYLAVYGAGSLPAPDQLRKSVAAFAGAGPEVACLQARLNTSKSPSWLARQFAIETASHHAVTLPASVRLGLAMVLEGSSGHFRTNVLQGIGGWDAHNLSEEADLGVRLARCGYRIGTLDSVTTEDAPARFRNWFRQRVTSLHGALQTIAVHLRDPRSLWIDVGARRFFALQVILAGTFAMALLHPVLVAHVVVATLFGGSFAAAGLAFADPLFLTSVLCLIIGYGAAIETALLGLYRTRRAGLLPQLILMPVSWLLASAAAWAAVGRFVLRPFSAGIARPAAKDPAAKNPTTNDPATDDAA